MTAAYLVAARRTAVAPVNGAFRALSVADLGVPVMHQLLADGGLRPQDVDQVILGNALYGGGNPARRVALAAGLPESCPAMTVDTQCCSGLDAIRLGAQAIQAGEADVVLAGGVESTSRRPIRQHRPLEAEQQPETYERPAFTPWPDRDPDMADSAARLAHQWAIGLEQQNRWAQASHGKALAARAELTREIVPLAGVDADTAARAMSERLAARTPVIARHESGMINVAGTALQADCAAMVLVVSERMLTRTAPGHRTIRWLAGQAMGGPADSPPWAVVPAVRALLTRTGLRVQAFQTVELMEAYAVQAQVNAEALGIAPEVLNPGGGALARGHPIGASGAILAVRAYHTLLNQPDARHALLAIAAAGGLASTAVLEAGVR